MDKLSETTEQQVRDLMEENCGICSDELGQADHLENDLGLDSLDRTELNMALENHFDIQIPDDDFDELLSLQQIVAYVNRRKAV